MKQRPPRKKKRLDLPGAAYQVLKKSKKPLSLREIYNMVQKSIAIDCDLSLSALHTELNFDGRFIFLNNRTWTLKSNVPHLKRKDYDEFDLLEVEYQPVKEDYKWSKEEEDSEDDESDLLVPYDGEEMELSDDDESPVSDDEEYSVEEEDDDDDYPDK